MPAVQKQHNRQADFGWQIPAIAGGTGLLAGWKLFGGNGDETEPNPVMFWSMLGLIVLLLIGLGIFAYKKLK